MWSKLGSFFSSFFKNIAADPASSIKGIAQLAAGGATCFGMATGTVPINVGAGIAAGFVTSGLHSLGTDSLTPAINVAATLAPQALTIADHYNAIKSQTGQAQAVLAAAAEAATILSPPPTDPAPPV
jgi:hypothetical protein